jgi:hypothetical protein
MARQEVFGRPTGMESSNITLFTAAGAGTPKGLTSWRAA